mmetsp:Transcript_15175/g.28271  ORF Transcript_15175/g.28271 Transcript_15175/m.28271 type:complete len:308 (-) Transcript_15175:90-1013(-)
MFRLLFSLFSLHLLLLLLLSPALSLSSDPPSKSFLSLLKSHLQSLRSSYTYGHIICYESSGSLTSLLHSHPGVTSWNLITSSPIHSQSLHTLYSSNSKVAVKTLYPDFSPWGSSPLNLSTEPGTFTEYSSYILESLYFSSHNPSEPYHVILAGHARVDTAVAFLPLLYRTDGRLIMNDFEGCDESLLQFYDLVKRDNEGNVVLKPKSKEEYRIIKDKMTYEWCFDYVDGTKVIQVEEGPMDAEGVVERFAEHVGCTDFEKGFFCENGEGGKKVNCLSCYAGFMGISKRGFWVIAGLEKILADKEKEL